MKRYVIGVDGGNTKTDYFLFDDDGNFVDYIRDGTCSHESLNDKYEGSYRIIKKNIDKILERNHITIEHISAGAFGLAGVDVPEQRENLEDVVERIGFDKFVVDNDSFLGIKAGIEKGYGVCSVNGTGTVAGGIDSFGNRLQIGGIGEISGDEAGGGIITRKLFRAVYDSLYRCSEETALIKPVMDLLGIEEKYYYIQAISKLYSSRFSHTPYVKLVFEYADKNDLVACKLIDNTALQLAKSTGGCINNLSFDEKVDVVLVGSIWVKPMTNILIDRYKKYVSELTNSECNYILLKVPPATGAVLWALELAHGKLVDTKTRKKVVEFVEYNLG